MLCHAFESQRGLNFILLLVSGGIEALSTLLVVSGDFEALSTCSNTM